RRPGRPELPARSRQLLAREPRRGRQGVERAGRPREDAPALRRAERGCEPAVGRPLRPGALRDGAARALSRRPGPPLPAYDRRPAEAAPCAAHDAQPVQGGAVEPVVREEVGSSYGASAVTIHAAEPRRTPSGVWKGAIAARTAAATVGRSAGSASRRMLLTGPTPSVRKRTAWSSVSPPPSVSAVRRSSRAMRSKPARAT